MFGTYIDVKHTSCKLLQSRKNYTLNPAHQSLFQTYLLYGS